MCERAGMGWAGAPPPVRPRWFSPPPPPPGVAHAPRETGRWWVCGAEESFSLGPAPSSVPGGWEWRHAPRGGAGRRARALVAVGNRHTGLLDGLFHGSVAKRLALQTRIPLLVLEH